MENKLKTGFNVGLNAEIPVAPDYFVQPGVLLSTKGAKLENDSKVNLSYVEIPVNFLYKPALGAGKMLLGFGPYVGFGVGGKVELPNGNDVDVEFENDDLKELVFWGSVSRFENSGEVLKMLEVTGEAGFKVKGTKVFVFKK